MIPNIESDEDRSNRKCRVVCRETYAPWRDSHQHDGPNPNDARRQCSRYRDRGTCNPLPGDVWFCEHGNVFVAEPELDSTTDFYIAPLHPIFDLKRYRRAITALHGGSR